MTRPATPRIKRERQHVAAGGKNKLGEDIGDGERGRGDNAGAKGETPLARFG